jgi:hypothetical protein
LLIGPLVNLVQRPLALVIRQWMPQVQLFSKPYVYSFNST